jgi:hypothetical protein
MMIKRTRLAIAAFSEVDSPQNGDIILLLK